MPREIEFNPDVLLFLIQIKFLSDNELFKTNSIEIHHFIITAGLLDLVSCVFKINKMIHFTDNQCYYLVIAIPQIRT